MATDFETLDARAGSVGANRVEIKTRPVRIRGAAGAMRKKVNECIETVFKSNASSPNYNIRRCWVLEFDFFCKIAFYALSGEQNVKNFITFYKILPAHASAWNIGRKGGMI